ncbi:hemopexin-like [Thalassophryne amazonica]|uniref:hemopexin-like n=1 Tax=Thalassophryne amazonica TaxID=390379 RepID=UPI001470A7E1|nr:hemopexin-like [Thalassophryne amazonica]
MHAAHWTRALGRLDMMDQQIWVYKCSFSFGLAVLHRLAQQCELPPQKTLADLHSRTMLSRIFFMCLALALTNGVPTVTVDATDQAPKKCSELANSNPMPGAYIPQCDQDGNYLPKQCHASTGHCWCVDEMGTEKEGTRWSAGTTPTNCEKPGDEVPKCSEIKIDAITTDDSGKSYMFMNQIYSQLDGNRDTFYINSTWKEVNDGVDAVYSYGDTINLIKNDQVYIYKKEASKYTLVDGYPKTLKEELSIEGHVDAAFICNNEHIVHVIQGHMMHNVNLTATPRVITENYPLPLSDIDAGLCKSEGVEVYKGSTYYEYASPFVLAVSRIAPEPLQVTSKQLKCQD